MRRTGLLLGVDTSASQPGAAVAALGESTEIVATCHLAAGPCQGEALAGCVSEVLARAGVGAGDLEALAVTRGPGSFTGVRVGLALVRGLALVDDTPVVGLESLELVAAAARADRRARVACAVLDAARDKVYVVAYEAGGGAPRRIGDPVVLHDGELAGFAAGLGPDWMLCAEENLMSRLHRANAGLEDEPAGQVCVTVPARRAETLVRVAAERLMAGEATAAEAVLPLYVAQAGARPNRNRVAISPSDAG